MTFLLAFAVAACAQDAAPNTEVCAGSKCDDLSDISLIGIDMDVDNPYAALRFDENLRIPFEDVAFAALGAHRLGPSAPLNPVELGPDGLFPVPHVQIGTSTKVDGTMAGLLVDTHDFVHLLYSRHDRLPGAFPEVAAVLRADGSAEQLPALHAYLKNRDLFRTALWDRLSLWVSDSMPEHEEIAQADLPDDLLFVTSFFHDDDPNGRQDALFVAPSADGGTRFFVAHRESGSNPQTFVEIIADPSASE